MNVDLPLQRLRNHHLTGPPLATPVDVVGWLGAVQAQEYAVAKWGIAQRTVDATDAGIDQLLAEGAIIRTHVLRPTWHFVLPADLRWLLDLTAPRVHALNAPYYRTWELDDAVFARSNALLSRALQGGREMTRTELAGVLAAGGITVRGDRLGFLMMRAELDAVICSGGRRGKQFTYALFDERVPRTPPRDRDDALAELARRYFASHGPATPHDFAWWSGLAVTDARRGAEMARPSLMEVPLEGKTYWSTARSARVDGKRPVVHLLPVYDEYLGSYKDDSPICDTALKDRLSPRTDRLTGHALVVDGKVAGGWKRTVKAREVVVSVDPLIPLGDAEQAAIEAQAARFGRFLGLPARLLPGDKGQD